MGSLAGDFLRATRKRQNVTQRDLAERVGSHQPQLSAWERGDKPVTVAQLAELLDALGLVLVLDSKPKAREGDSADPFAFVGKAGPPPTRPRRRRRS